MAPRKVRARISRTPEPKSGSTRGSWKGSIAFGLVNIPIYLVSGLEPQRRISFHLLDKKDKSPVGYKNYNKRTGEIIPRQRIIKAFKLNDTQYVTLTDEDFEKAYPKSARMIEIEDFVDLESIDPMLFERPYFVAPLAGGEKGYLLLRDVLARSHKVGIAKFVLNSKQHLVAIMAHGDHLLLELLRFAGEIKTFGGIKEVKVSPRELTIAEELVGGMSSKWQPGKFKDTYQEDLRRIIEQKAKRGAVTEVEELPASETEAQVDTNVVDLTALLRRSLAAATQSGKRKKAA